MFAGQGSYYSYLKEYTNDLELIEHVKFLGHIDHKILPHYYNMADVLILPSIMEGVRW